MGTTPQAPWELKLRALLHDPPFKVLGIREHERAARELRAALGLLGDDPDEVREADRLASAADRTVLSRGETGEVRWGAGERNGEPAEVFFHPMSSAKLLGDRGDDCSNRLREILRTDLLHRALPDLWEALSQRLRSVHDRLGGDRRKEFLYLWRMLPRLWVESLEIGPGGPAEFVLTQLFPADSRLPDHSIFDHLVTASAFTVNRPTLVMVDIGGVQQFLQQSRRVRDLWASSYLVSSLAMAGIMVVVSELGPDSLIYPDLRGDPLLDLYLLSEGVLTEEELASYWGGDDLGELIRSLLVPAVPSTFLFIAPEAEVEELEGRIANAIQSLIWRLGEAVLQETFGDLTPQIRDHWRRQLGSGLPHPLQVRIAHVTLEDLEGFWRKLRESCRDLSEDEVERKVMEALRDFVPFQAISWWEKASGEADSTIRDLATVLTEDLRHGYAPKPTLLYSIAYAVLSLRIRAEKLMAQFSEQEEPSSELSLMVSKRCRLCGERNPLVLGVGGSRWAEEGWRELVRELRRRGSHVGWLLSPEEPLCAVCFVKRVLRRPRILINLWSAILEYGNTDPKVGLGRVLTPAIVRHQLRPLPTLDDIAARPFLLSLLNLSSSEDLKVQVEELKIRISEALADAFSLLSSLDESPEISKLDLGGLLGIVSDAWRIIPEPEGGMSWDDLLSSIRERLDALEIPGSLLYRPSWEAALRDLDKLEESPAEESIIALARKTKESFRGVLSALDLLGRVMTAMGEAATPSNYVAFIKADGDDLGLWISGGKFSQLDISVGSRLHPWVIGEFRRRGPVPKIVEAHRLMTPSLHRSLSRILAGLAREVFPRLIEEVGGVVFYSGGDDLLAVIPASDPENTPISLVERIYRAFTADIVSLDRRLVLGMGRLATLSAGLVISHRLVPMWESLERVRLEEEVAKGEVRVSEGWEDDDRGEKGRLSLTKLSRSLTDERAIISLREFEGSEDRAGICVEPRGGPLERLERRVSELILRSGDVWMSKNATRDLEEILELVDRDVSEGGVVGGDDVEVVHMLMQRTVTRNIHSASGMPEEVFKVAEEILGLYLGLATSPSGVNVRRALNLNRAIRLGLSEVLRGVSK